MARVWGWVVNLVPCCVASGYKLNNVLDPVKYTRLFVNHLPQNAIGRDARAIIFSRADSPVLAARDSSRGLQMPTKRSVAIVAIPPVGTGTRIRCKATAAIVALVDSFPWGNVSLDAGIVIHLFRWRTCFVWRAYCIVSGLQHGNTGRTSYDCVFLPATFRFVFHGVLVLCG